MLDTRAECEGIQECRGRQIGHRRAEARESVRRPLGACVDRIRRNGGISVRIGAVGFKTRGQGAHVGLAPGDLGPRLRLQKVGQGDGREYCDNRDDDQQFDERKSFHSCSCGTYYSARGCSTAPRRARSF